jgi:hypothetical protein
MATPEKTLGATADSEVDFARSQMCAVIRGYSEDRHCAQWLNGIEHEIRALGGLWTVLAVVCGGWPLGVGGADGWDPVTPEEAEIARALFAISLREIQD